MRNPLAAHAALALALALVLVLLAPTALGGGGPAETVVLLNEASPDSVRVVEHYVRARGIPPTQVCRVRSATDLTVPVADFVRDVVDPLRRFLEQRGLAERCRFIVLTQGFPIRTRNPGGIVSTAALLELLDTPIAGADQARMPRFQNTYREGPAPAGNAAGDGRLYLVTALLSSTADEAIALIDRSVAADGTAPANARFVYQDARGNAGNRNPHYDAARDDIERLGHTTEHVEAGADIVRGRKKVMGYMAGGSYSAMTVEGVGDNEYLPGAICDLLQSFGAVPENFVPDGKGKQFPVTHMIRAGITGVHGAVAEPYNVAFPSADLFEPYVQGYTLAETFHQKLPFRYWMNLVLGDPLCAPYAERPEVKVSGAPTGAWKGDVTLRVRAKDAVRLELYVDGVSVRAIDGDSGDMTIPTASFADGGRHVLLQAQGPGEHEPRGWVVLSPTFTNDVAAPAGPPPAAAPAGLRVEAPEEVIAGEPFDVRVVALDAAGEPVAAPGLGAWLRSTKPPVRWARDVPLDGSPRSMQLTKVGTLAFAAEIPGVLVSDSATVRVRPAEVRFVTTPLSQVASGQVIDIPVRAEDRFGNVVDDYEGEIELETPGHPGSDVGLPAVMVKGRGVLRDVLLTRSGPRRIVFKDGAGDVVSSPQEGLRLAPAAVRAWLLSNPVRGADAESLFERGPALSPHAPGDVTGGLVFTRHRDGDDEILVTVPGLADGDSVVAVAFVEALLDTQAELHAAAPGRIAVALDGKVVHFGEVPDGTDPANRRKRPKIATIDVAKGRHRLTVVAERKGKLAFSLQVVGGGEEGRLVRIVADSGETASTRSISGRVLRPGSSRGAADVEVALVSGAATQRVQTDRDGQFWFGDLAAGDVTLRVAGAPDRKIDLGAENVAGITVRLEDRAAPTVDLPADLDGSKVGKTLRVAPAVRDDGEIRSVCLVLDGEIAGPTLTKAPWSFEIDVSARPRGTVTVEVRAADAAGQEGVGGPVRVTLVADTSGPSVTLSGLSSNRVLKEALTVTAKASDQIGVASVDFAVDDAPLGAVDTTAPYEVVLDPANFEKGKHVLTVTARDSDGNETTKRLPFRVR